MQPVLVYGQNIAISQLDELAELSVAPEGAHRERGRRVAAIDPGGDFVEVLDVSTYSAPPVIRVSASDPIVHAAFLNVMHVLQSPL